MSENLVWLKRIAFGFWALFIVVVIIKCFVAPYKHSLYPLYATSGRIWWFGSNATDFYAYGPFFAQLMGPFAGLPDKVGGALWYVFSFLFFLCGLYKFLTRVLPEPNGKTISIFFLLVPWCGIASLYNGQANLIIVGCLLWAVAAIAAEHWWLGSFALAGSVSIKAYPVAMAMVLTGLYPRKLLLRLLLAMVCLGCLPFVFHEWDFVLQRYAHWLSFLTDGVRYTNAGSVHVDFRTLLDRWIVVISLRSYILIEIITGVLVFACVYAYHRSRENERQTLLYAYILTSIWLVLFGPASEEATYILASPAVCWLLIDAYRRKKIIPILYLTIAGLFVGPFQTDVFGGGFRKWVLAQKLAPLGLTIFFLHQVAGVFRRRVPDKQQKDQESVRCALG